MNIEEQIKQFLDDECEKYKNIILDGTNYSIHTMVNEIHNYFYENRTVINSLSLEQFKKIENYAVQLSENFIDKNVAHMFWYCGVSYGYQITP